jgi:hypothetical protein
MLDHDTSFPNVSQGRKAVTAAGTAERLVSTNTPCRKVEIQALEANSDMVVIGGSGVVAAAATRQGIALIPGQVFTLRVEDLYNIYVDAVVSGEGVSYVYFY